MHFGIEIKKMFKIFETQTLFGSKKFKTNFLRSFKKIQKFLDPETFGPQKF